MHLMKSSVVVAFSNTALLALCFAGLIQAWDQQAFDLFLVTKLSKVLPWSLLYPAFLITMPMFPRPKKVPLKDTAKPSPFQARTMAVVTAVMDYVVVGSLFIFWNSTCRLSDGSLCPFSAAATLLVLLAVMPVKDEVQCRVMWRKFVSPLKLNSWYYSWKYLFGQLSTTFFGVTTFLILCLSGLVAFESITNPKVLLQIWVEAVAAQILTTLVMHGVHKWMHKRAYSLHKKHHKAKADLMCLHTVHFDLFDIFVESGLGMLVLISCKGLLGLGLNMHLLSHHLVVLMNYQNHSGNPYASVFFHPVIDYLSRSNVCHNLHHVVQKGYYGIYPFDHFVSAANRRKDVALYNKHMRTHFPC